MPPRGPAGGPPSDEQREEIRKKMEVVKKSRLTEELKLDEKTAAKFIPVITALDQKRRSLMKEQVGLRGPRRGPVTEEMQSPGK